MSILLDALKKSEEQRQLGATPTISSPTPEGPGPALSEMEWLPLAMMALSVVLMTWIGWQQYREPDWGILPDTVREPARIATQPETSEPTGARPGAPAEAVEDAPRTLVEAPPEPRTTITVDMPAEDDRQDQLDRLNRSFSDYRAETQAPAGEAGTPPPAEADQPMILPELPADARPEVAASGDPEPAEPDEPQPISFWELPQGVRDSMPELQITVLVYAEDPEDRFLLVSGRRATEGEELEGGVTLEEIRREGAVFTYRKYRFLMKG